MELAKLFKFFKHCLQIEDKEYDTLWCDTQSRFSVL